VLDFLLSGDQADVVVANVHKVLEDVGKEAREGRVSVADYVVTRGLNKPVEKYPDSKAQPHLRVAKAMLKEGRAVNVGDHIPYVICTVPVSYESRRWRTPGRDAPDAAAATPARPRATRTPSTRDSRHITQASTSTGTRQTKE